MAFSPPPPFMPTSTGNFDPTQWSNPYSQFYGQALPWPPSYAGAPTDAYGRPIQSYQAPQAPAAQPQQPPGMTLNQPAPTGLAGAQMSNNILAGMQGKPVTQMSTGLPAQGVGAWGSVGSNPADLYNLFQGLSTGMPQNTGAAGYGQGAPAAAASAPAAAPNNYNAALSALANPGPLARPGATVPQSPIGYQPGPGVLQQFLQNWNPAQSGPGAGFQQGFAKALGR